MKNNLIGWSILLILILGSCQKEEIIEPEVITECEYIVDEVVQSTVTLANGRTFWVFYGDDFRFISRSRRFEVGECIDQYVHQFDEGGKDFSN